MALIKNLISKTTFSPIFKQTELFKYGLQAILSIRFCGDICWGFLNWATIFISFILMIEVLEPVSLICGVSHYFGSE